MQRKLFLPRNFFVLVSLILLANTFYAQNVLSINSPDSNITLIFSLTQEQPYYSVQYNSTTIIKNSSLGFKLKDHPPLRKHFKISNSETKVFNKKWGTIWGPEDSIENNYNELFIELAENTAAARKMNIRFRVFNDGIGFRYEFPKQKNMDSVQIIDELTEFNFTDDHFCWWIPGDYDSYEYLYNHTKISEIDLSNYNYSTRGDRNQPNKHAVNTPITLTTRSGLYVSLHEANLTDYAGITLEAKSNYSFEVDLVPWSDGIKVKTKVPFKSPWRTIQISTKPQDLIASNLILNLNDPNKIKDISWIEPMKYMGVWWEMHIGKSRFSLTHKKEGWGADKGIPHGANTENAKRYIDFASQNNIKGILIEGWNTGWEFWGTDTLDYFDFINPYPDFDLEGIVKYAKEKGVEIIGHNETGGQAVYYEKHLEDAFKLYNKLGIKAVKTGYAGQIIPKGEFHHGQYMVRHYRKVLETAAKYKIMIDAHEPIAPTGIRRTYPNMMTREGVRGMEYNAWSEGNTPEHTTILPFTRMLAGPIDYTPGIFDLLFDKYRDTERVHTTLAKQLALYVVIYSPLQMAADLPENYEGHPAFDFIKKVPVDWDKSVYLNSKIGDYVTIARKNGENWYLGSISDELSRIVHVSLSFLDKDKCYKAKIFKDGKDANWLENPYEIEIEEQIVDCDTQLRIKLAEGGGQAIIFEPISNNDEKLN